MHSKGISQTLWIVISAIVIIVVALVVLTIFGGGIRPITTIGEAISVCQTSCTATCSSVGIPPITWNAPTANVNGVAQSCSKVAGTCTCPSSTAAGGTTPPGTGGSGNTGTGGAGGGGTGTGPPTYPRPGT